MKILVTGSSGMIGSELVPALEKAGHEVWGLDKRMPEFTPMDKFFQHNLCSEFKSLEVFDGIELIIHLAANARVWELVEDPELALENVITTHRVFELARKMGAKVMMASSREVYGNGNDLPVAESIGSQRSTESTYAASKVFGEACAWAYTKSYNLDTKIVRFSNVYGKYDFSDRFIPKVIQKLKENKPVEIWGKGKFLDFTYITDTVDGIIHLIDNWDEMYRKEWNIASGKGFTLLEVATVLKQKMGSSSEIQIMDAHPGEVLEYEADINRMQSCGWSPKIGIQEGLDKSIEYYNAS